MPVNPQTLDTARYRTLLSNSFTGPGCREAARGFNID